MSAVSFAGLSTRKGQRQTTDQLAKGQVDVIHDHTTTGPLYAHRPPVVPVVTTINGRLLPEVAEIYRAMSRDTTILGISCDQIHQAPDVPTAGLVRQRGPVRTRTDPGTGPVRVIAAQARGVEFGRPAPMKSTVEARLRLARQLMADGVLVKDAAEAVSWSRATLYRYLKQYSADGPVPETAVTHGRGRSQYAARK